MFNGNGQLLAPEQQNQGSSSRSPSPHSRIPVGSSPRQVDVPLAPPVRAMGFIDRSRSPSPDKHSLPHLPRLSSSPSRAASPLGRPARGPRPLPNPFSRSNGSQQSLGGVANPSRSRTGSSANHADDEDAYVSMTTSRKALGKRRAVADEDSGFFPPSYYVSTDPGQINSTPMICSIARNPNQLHLRRVLSRTRFMSSLSATYMTRIRRGSTSESGSSGAGSGSISGRRRSSRRSGLGQGAMTSTMVQAQ